jgi:hypothetical protein
MVSISLFYCQVNGGLIVLMYATLSLQKIKRLRADHDDNDE